MLVFRSMADAQTDRVSSCPSKQSQLTPRIDYKTTEQVNCRYRMPWQMNQRCCHYSTEGRITWLLVERKDLSTELTLFFEH